MSQRDDPRFSNHVAWLRYTERSIVVCDSDAPGAFKVYRIPANACKNCGAAERPDSCSGGPWCAYPRREF